MTQASREFDPDKTVPVADPNAPARFAPQGGEAPPPPPSVAETEEQIQAAAKSNETNLDTLIGRLVVETGLATPEEVQHCLEMVQGTIEPAVQRSLAHALVANEFVTKRQIARLKQILEAERSGQTIPGYKLLGKLGAGAMATVFKAKQLSLDRTVAIKILPKKFGQNPQFVERFYAEGRAAAQLNHPNIVQAYDVGKAGEYHFFVMEYVEGRTVYDDIVKHKRFPEREAVDIAIQCAEALQHAHERGLIHRDIKPKNVMINREGVVKVADLGLARAISDKEAAEAEQGKAFGTPYYISPEQIRGEVNVGPPTDIYSLGATLYHMVTGSVPFDGKNPSSVMHKHLKSELVPPDQVNPKLSSGVAEVIEMMMAKSASKRYQTCRDLLIDLKAVRDGHSPPLAHKDAFDAQALASVVEAEAAAPAQQALDREAELKRDRKRHMVRDPLFIALVVTLAVSLLFNVILFVARLG
ncbi:MAG: serine/threonine protein kinase [Phycisphaeraceae bacterium]|nr:serine/threonine protein kinase [Phycisphaeraceae bacterium]MCW5754358.1 serine/threonine protein kinase [Phycisphaeraceae bacterium]